LGNIGLKNEFSHHRTTVQSPDLADAPLVRLLQGRLALPIKTGFTVGNEGAHREFVNVSFGNPEHRKCGLIRHYETLFVIQQNRRLHRIRHLLGEPRLFLPSLSIQDLSFKYRFPSDLDHSSAHPLTAGAQSSTNDQQAGSHHGSQQSYAIIN
jgi:hypothetical protein